MSTKYKKKPPQGYCYRFSYYFIRRMAVNRGFSLCKYCITYTTIYMILICRYLLDIKITDKYVINTLVS